jgi:hypothetical protein
MVNGQITIACMTKMRNTGVREDMIHPTEIIVKMLLLALAVLMIATLPACATTMAKSPSYWGNAYCNDQIQQLTEDDWSYINSQSYLYKYTYTQVRHSTGEIDSFTVPVFTEPYREWLFDMYMDPSHARVLAHKLSAQLIAAELNVRHGNLYGDTPMSVSQCSTITANDAIAGAQGALISGDIAAQTYYENALEKINSGRTKNA